MPIAMTVWLGFSGNWSHPLPSTVVILSFFRLTCFNGPYGELNFVDLKSDMYTLNNAFINKLILMCALVLVLY